MTNVVQFASPRASVASIRSSCVPQWEAMRRRDIKEHLRRLLGDNSRDGVVFRLVPDAVGLRVDAVVQGRTTTVAAPRSEDDIDNFAGIVRAGLGGWRAALARRAAFRVLH